MRLYVVIFALVALTLVPVLVFGDEIDEHFAGEEGLRRLEAYGGWAWLAGIALIVSDLFLPVPSTAVIAGLGMMYGPWLGGLIGGVGSTLAGLVAYAGGRWVGRPAVKLFVGPADLERLSRFFTRHGLWAIALSRWMPLLPEALCCLAGTAKMRPGHFLAALACGSFAMGFAFGFLGMSYLDKPAAGLVLSALIPLAVWPPVHYFLRRPAVQEPESSGSGVAPGGGVPFPDRT
jgi:uncharacterized membrane protein YdjX (TVP38/TMEM64 family)